MCDDGVGQHAAPRYLTNRQTMPGGRQRRLDKSTLSLTFKFDSDRFLRFRLATAEERATAGFAPEVEYRPGIRLIREAGRRWEIDKYDDLIVAASASRVRFEREPDVDPVLERRKFAAVTDLFPTLRRVDPPPVAIIEGEFAVPAGVTPALEQAYRDYDLDPVGARPDILWIRPGGTGSPLLGPRRVSVPWELHIIDVKMAAEPSLRHFTEVTFYALALAKAIEEQGLSDRYAVSAEGLIWPGSHDANDFRNRIRHFTARGHPDPLTAALVGDHSDDTPFAQGTLKAVPYEVYHVHVKQFFEERLPRVMAQAPLDVPWHVSPNCQLCEYLGYCSAEAERTDHLSRIAWLTAGQAQALREHGIMTTADLARAIRDDAPRWQAAVEANHQLRADRPALLARAEALLHGRVQIAEGRKVASMPRYTDMDVYLTVHFDPGSGVTFAMGASRVYFRPDRGDGAGPVREEQHFVVERMDNLSTDTERARLVELLRLITRWFEEAHAYNVRLHDTRTAAGEKDRAYGKVRVHCYFWDSNELRQLRRMLERHLGDAEVVEFAETLVRMFPPDDRLPDPTAYRSQPGTIVKDVFRQLVGVPIPHDYTLLEVANAFHPRLMVDRETGEERPYVYRLPYGFVTELSDQIPFERAYELWSGRVQLRRFTPEGPDTRVPYTWHEIYEGIRNAVGTRLDALRHVVGALRRHYGDRLVLQKGPFSIAPPAQMRGVPDAARQLNALEQLDVAAAALENRAIYALPVEEREARFHSIRGLRRAGPSYAAAVDEVRVSKPRYASRDLEALVFATTSRDARISAGDFLLALTNEGPPPALQERADLHVPWREQLGWDGAQAESAVADAGLDSWIAYAPLRALLEVEVARLEAAADPPYLVLSIKYPQRMALAEEFGLLDWEQPMVLDPLHEDFSSKQVTLVLRTVGNRRAR